MHPEVDPSWGEATEEMREVLMESLFGHPKAKHTQGGIVESQLCVAQHVLALGDLVNDLLSLLKAWGQRCLLHMLRSMIQSPTSWGP